jgi:hypothetical protein
MNAGIKTVPNIDIITAIANPLLIPCSTANLPISNPAVSEPAPPVDDAAAASKYLTERFNFRPIWAESVS